MSPASSVCIAVAVACFVQICQSQDVQANGQSVQARFLGGLNRYYVHTWDEEKNGTVYTNLLNNAASIDDGDCDATDTSNDCPTVSTENPGAAAPKKVAIVIHGRNGAGFSDFTNTLVKSFIENDKSSEVIVVDWSLVAGMDYTTAFNAVPFVADDIISRIITWQTERNLDMDLVHLVGFDVGAHIAGMVNRDARVGAKKITGLSPARQNWDAFSRRLNATDADFVEVVHSDYLGVSALGIGDQIGTVDAYLNTGTAQPGCTNSQCNHDRAWQVFAATLDSGGHLSGLRCETLADMTRNTCTGFPALQLGTDALEKDAEGIYRFNTGRVYPYNA